MNIEQRLADSADALDAAIDSYNTRGRRSKIDRTRWLASAAAVAIVVVGVGGVALVATRGPSAPEPAATSPTGNPPVTTTVEPATADPATAPLPEPLEAGESPTDGTGLLGNVNALVMGVGTRNEMIAFFSGNVSEDEIDACMSAAGFDYVRDLTPEEQVADDVRFSVSPAEYAAMYGFGVTGWDLGVIPPLQVSRDGAGGAAVGTQTPEYYEMVDQCSGRFDEDRRAESDAMTVSVDLFRAAIAPDERIVAGLAAWRTCVVDAGYDFESPMAMRQTFYDRLSAFDLGRSDETLQQIFDDEVRTAVANEPCEIAYNTVQREVIASRFSEFQAMFDAALASGASPDAQG